jgi:hypothetical protein
MAYKENIDENLKELKEEFEISDEVAAKYFKYVLGLYSGMISGGVFCSEQITKNCCPTALGIRAMGDSNQDCHFTLLQADHFAFLQLHSGSNLYQYGICRSMVQ